MPDRGLCSRLRESPECAQIRVTRLLPLACLTVNKESLIYLNSTGLYRWHGAVNTYYQRSRFNLVDEQFPQVLPSLSARLTVIKGFRPMVNLHLNEVFLPWRESAVLALANRYRQTIQAVQDYTRFQGVKEWKVRPRWQRRKLRLSCPGKFHTELRPYLGQSRILPKDYMARVAGESRNQGSDKCLRLILKVECDIRDDFTARVCRCRGC